MIVSPIVPWSSLKYYIHWSSHSLCLMWLKEWLLVQKRKVGLVHSLLSFFVFYLKCLFIMFSIYVYCVLDYELRKQSLLGATGIIFCRYLFTNPYAKTMIMHAISRTCLWKCIPFFLSWKAKGGSLFAVVTYYSPSRILPAIEFPPPLALTYLSFWG